MTIYLQTNSDGEKSQGYINSGKREGIGAICQYQLMLYSICRKFNVEFYNSGFKNIGHSTYNNFQGDWSNCFTKFFNFSSERNIENKFSFSDIDHYFINFIEENKNNDHDILIYLDPEKVLTYGQSIVDEIYEKEYLKEIKNNFVFSGNYFSSNYLNISFHIRSLNPEDIIFQDCREYYNLKEIDKYIGLIDSLKNICLGEKVKLHIHSQGNTDDFLKLLKCSQNNFEVVLHLNDDPISDIYHMAHSDLLIMANSSFSWISHLLNYNTTIVRDNFWHAIYPNTLKMNGDYCFDFNKLKIKS